MKLVRRMFRGGKVWAEVDEQGRLVTDAAGLTRLRYREDDDRTYTARADDVREIDEAELERARKERATRRAAKRARSRAAEPDTLRVFTEGACFGNPGPAGVGVVLDWKGTHKEISRPLGDAHRKLAELRAVEAGLRAVKRPEVRVRLHTASAFAIGVLSGDWQAGRHAELVAAVKELMRGFRDLELVRRKGTADPLGERAEQLARDAVDGDRVERGPDPSEGAGE